MAWTWRCENGAGVEVEGPEPGASFPSRADAESWLGEVWRELLEDGVDRVRLFEDGREVYGPMSLHGA